MMLPISRRGWLLLAGVAAVYVALFLISAYAGNELPPNPRPW